MSVDRLRHKLVMNELRELRYVMFRLGLQIIPPSEITMMKAIAKREPMYEYVTDQANWDYHSLFHSDGDMTRGELTQLYLSMRIS